MTSTTPHKGRPDPRRREPLWDRVDKNKIRLAAYVAAFVLCSVVTFDVGLVLFGWCMVLSVMMRSGMYSEIEWLLEQSLPALLLAPSIGVGLLAVSWAAFALMRSEKWLLRLFDARLVPKGELMESKLALKDMAIAAGMPIAPALYVLETSNVNAFIFTARSRRPVVGITRGMAQRLTPSEQRAVFANLVARLRSGDAVVDTAVMALMWPLHTWRDRQFYRQNSVLDEELLEGGHRVAAASETVVPLFLFGVAFAFISSVFAFLHRRKQLRAAEKADAEGMLLLKDPQAMLSALERCIALNNVVTKAGEGFADLFYCWTGDSTDDEDDPEWHRVARLREVLGVEGFIADDEPLDEGALPPPPPRLTG